MIMIVVRVDREPFGCWKQKLTFQNNNENEMIENKNKR